MNTILLLLLFLGFLALVFFLSGKLRALEVSDRASAYALKPSVLTPAEIRALVESHLPGLPYPRHRRGAS